MAEQTKKSFVLQAIIVIILVVGGYILFSELRSSEHKQYIAYFNNIQGLQPSSPVQIQGVRVGKISDIIPDSNQLKVMISVNSDIMLPEGTRASLASGGATGERFINLQPGKGTKMLEENAVLASNTDSSVLPMSVRITPMIETAKMVLNSADVGLTGITYLINGGLATQSMEMLIAAEKKAKKLEEMAENINNSTSGLREPILNAKNATADMAAHTGQTTQSIKELEQTTAKASRISFSNSLDTLRENINAIGQSFKQLKNNKALTDKKMYEKATETTDNANRDVKDLMDRANK